MASIRYHCIGCGYCTDTANNLRVHSRTCTGKRTKRLDKLRSDYRLLNEWFDDAILEGRSVSKGDLDKRHIHCTGAIVSLFRILLDDCNNNESIINQRAEYLEKLDTKYNKLINIQLLRRNK